MASKRKRARCTACPPRKCAKLNDGGNKMRSPVLTSCYPRVLTLREYFLARLPASSCVRRKNLEELGELEHDRVLDTCLVGVLTDPSAELQQERAQELVTFTQTQGIASGCHTSRGQSCSVDEVCQYLAFRSTEHSLTAPTRWLTSSSGFCLENAHRHPPDRGTYFAMVCKRELFREATTVVWDRD